MLGMRLELAHMPANSEHVMNFVLTFCADQPQYRQSVWPYIGSSVEFEWCPVAPLAVL